MRMQEKKFMGDYGELVERLRQYSYERKGEIAKLTHDAAIAISSLEAKVNVLENQLKEGGKEK